MGIGPRVCLPSVVVAMNDIPERRPRGQSPRHRGRSQGILERQMPWQLLRNPYKPLDIVSTDELEAIHDASLDLLETIGMNVASERARSLLRRAGAEIMADQLRVRFPRELVLETIRSAPSSFRVSARNPARDVMIGDGWLVFSPVSSAPNASGLGGGRRPGTFEDYCRFLKLAHVINVLHVGVGYPVEPTDLPVPMRHLDAGHAMLTLTDKVVRVYCHSAERARDMLELTRLCHGLSVEAFQAAPRSIAIINTNSPLQLDTPMVEGIIEVAEANQVVIVTPFTLAGAMAPVTLAGALAQQNAEALAGIVVSQLARKGAPVIYGAFTTNVNMKSGAPAFGTPEYAKAALISGQLARRYNLPFRSSGIATSNAPDAQGAYETMMSMWAAIMGGVNFLHQAAGWLEGGLTASFEKLMLDIEQLQMFASFLVPERIDADTLARSTIAEVGPGGHFFGSPHTLERYETAFYAPLVSDWRNYESWAEDGALSATDRAARLAQEALDAYVAPTLDPARREAMDAFIAKRREDGGSPVN